MKVRVSPVEGFKEISTEAVLFHLPTLNARQKGNLPTNNGANDYGVCDDNVVGRCSWCFIIYATVCPATLIS